MTLNPAASLPTLSTAFDLRGRVAVVTGAASGIGRETAILLAAAGADVVAADCAAKGVQQTADSVRSSGGSADAVVVDVAERDDVDALAALAARYGAIDIWANVAGILRSGSVVDTEEERFDEVINVNLKGAMWGAIAAARVMVPAGRGSIVNVASAAGEMASPGAAAYGISKAGVISLTRTLAVELGPSGVRVNAVAPGMVQTPMSAAFFDRPPGSRSETSSNLLERAATTTPIATIGQPIDIALAILYLAADASRFVTGQVLRPNGGMVLG